MLYKRFQCLPNKRDAERATHIRSSDVWYPHLDGMKEQQIAAFRDGVFISQIYRSFFLYSFGRVLFCLWSSKLSTPPLHLLPLTFYLLPLSNFPWKRDTFRSCLFYVFFSRNLFRVKNRSFHFHYNLLLWRLLSNESNIIVTEYHIFWRNESVILLSMHRCA